VLLKNICTKTGILKEKIYTFEKPRKEMDGKANAPVKKPVFLGGPIQRKIDRGVLFGIDEENKNQMHQL